MRGENFTGRIVPDGKRGQNFIRPRSNAEVPEEPPVADKKGGTEIPSVVVTRDTSGGRGKVGGSIHGELNRSKVFTPEELQNF